MHDAQRERLLQKEVVLVHHNPFFTNHPLPFHETILNSPHFPIMGKFRKLNPPLHKEREGGGGVPTMQILFHFQRKEIIAFYKVVRKNSLQQILCITAFRRLPIDCYQLNDFSSLSQLNWYLDHHFKRCEE